MINSTRLINSTLLFDSTWAWVSTSSPWVRLYSTGETTTLLDRFYLAEVLRGITKPFIAGLIGLTGRGILRYPSCKSFPSEIH